MTETRMTEDQAGAGGAVLLLDEGLTDVDA